MKYKYYVILSCIMSLSAVCWYFYQQSIIIVLPRGYNTEQQKNITSLLPEKIKIALWYWHHEKWQQEIRTIISNTLVSQKTKQIINLLLEVLFDEQLLTKKIALESVTLSASEIDCYLSFDHNLSSSEVSIWQNAMVIESILKTLRENNIKSQNIHFLVHHQPMQDLYLDFSHPWPLSGFI